MKKNDSTTAGLVVGAATTMALADMIAAAGLSGRYDANINEQNFPLSKEGSYDHSGLSLFGGDRERSIAEAAVELGGGRLEGLVRGLAYIRANPKVLKGGPIVFPASSCAGSKLIALFPYAILDRHGEPWLLLCWDVRLVPRHRRFRFLVSGMSGT